MAIFAENKWDFINMQALRSSAALILLRSKSPSIKSRYKKSKIIFSAIKIFLGNSPPEFGLVVAAVATVFMARSALYIIQPLCEAPMNYCALV